MRAGLLIAIALAVTGAACRFDGDEPTRATIVAFDSTTNAELWEADVPVAAVSTIAEHRGVVLIVGYNACPSGAAEIVALNWNDGALLWQAPVFGPGCDSEDVVVVDEGLVVVCGAGGASGVALVGLDIADGAERWRAGGRCATEMTATGAGAVLVGGSLIDIASGEERWTANFDGGADLRTIGVTADAIVQLASTRAERFGEDLRTLVGRDLGTGAERWRFELGVQEASEVSVATGDGVVAASRYDYAPDGITRTYEVVVVDAGSGAELRRIAYGPDGARVVAVAHGRALISVREGAETTVYAVSVATGETLELPFLTLDRLTGRPIVTDRGLILFAPHQIVTQLHIDAMGVSLGDAPDVLASAVGAGNGRIYTAQSGRPTQIDY